jgi:hypothetical protein
MTIVLTFGMKEILEEDVVGLFFENEDGCVSSWKLFYKKKRFLKLKTHNQL